MDLMVIFYISIFAVLLFLSAVFSGSETAFFSLRNEDREKYETDSSGRGRRIASVLAKPQKLLTSIVIGNTFVNIAVASIAAYLTHDLAQQNYISPQIIVIVDIIVVTFVILILSEILPKIIAVRQNVAFVERFELIVWIFFWILYPVSWIINKFVGDIAHHIKKRSADITLSENELKTLMEYGEEHVDLDKDEKEMITSIFEFGETTVKEIILPRTDMIAFNVRNSFDELMQLISNTHFSRIPVYEGKIDNVVGILYVKDLLPFLAASDSKNIDIRTLLRPVYFVPEQKNIDALLREFQNERIHIAIVVDEYGGTAGMITLEDILEEIVGEIQDEFDVEKPLIRMAGDKSWYVSGKAPIEDLEESLQINIPEIEEVETVGGLILTLKGSIPVQGEKIKHEGLLFTILKVTRQRIIEVKIELVDKDNKADSDKEVEKE